jgi:TrmH family RNA methyltransferase
MARTTSSGVPLKPLKWYKRLATESGRLESRAFLVEGDRAIAQIMDSHPDEVLEVLTYGDNVPGNLGLPVRRLTESRYRAICTTKNPQSMAAVVRLPLDTYSDTLPEACGERVLLLEDIQDPGNVGTLIRTATAFGFDGAVLTDKCADPFNPKCVQATAGTVLNLWIRRSDGYMELAESLRGDGYVLIATDLEGVDDPSVLHCHEKLLLALGNEGVGLSERLLSAADHRFRVPIARDKAESLNVAACGAICMYLSSLNSG